MPAITAEIALELSKLKDSVNKAVGEVRKMKTNMKREGDGLGAAIFGGLKTAAKTAAVAAGAAIATTLAGTAVGLKNAFDLGGELTDLAAQIGTSAGKAQILRQAFENAGLGADGVQAKVNKMQKSIAEASKGGQSAGIFKALKLDVEELMAMDPADAFTIVGDAIAAIDDPTKRAAASMEIFGKSGGKLLSLFGDSGALGFASEQLGRQSEILDKSAGDFDRASDILGGAFRKVQGFFVGMGSRIIDALMPLLDAFNKLDLAGMGERFGDAIMRAVNLLRAAWEELDLASVASLLGDALKLAIQGGINTLYAGFMAVASAWLQMLIEGVKNVIAMFQIMTTSGFWKGMLNVFIGIAHSFAAALLGLIGVALSKIKKIPGASSIIGDLDQGFKSAGAQRGRDAAGRFKQGADLLTPAAQTAMTRMGEMARAVADAFMDEFRQTENIFDTGPETDRLKEAIAKIRARADEIAAAAANAKEVKTFEAERTDAGDSGGGKTRIRTPGLFASAVNLIMGRSVNELIHDEARKTNQLLGDIKRNTAPKPQANASGDLTLTFA